MCNDQYNILPTYPYYQSVNQCPTPYTRYVNGPNCGSIVGARALRIKESLREQRMIETFVKEQRALVEQGEALEADHKGFVDVLRVANIWRAALTTYSNAVDKLEFSIPIVL